MKQMGKLFRIGMKQISRDGMLLALIPAPFLVGIFFKFAIPFMDHLLTKELAFSIAPWYGLADGMLLSLTPLFVAMISAFLLLEERDEGISAFYQITPSGGFAYLGARIGMPMLWAFVASLIVAGAFNLSSLSWPVIVAGALIGSLTGIFLALMVVALAGNRVEGLAVSKLMGISFLGLILIWFIPAPYHYLMAFLPSFWVGKLLMDGGNILTLAGGMGVCFFWIAVFSRMFLKKV